MKEYYSDDWVTLYHGDCLGWLSGVPDCLEVDAVVTDPPWNLGFFKDDERDAEDYILWLESCVRQFESLAGGQVWFLSTKLIPTASHLFAEDYTPFASIKNFSQMTPTKLPNCWDIAFIRSTSYKGNGRNWFMSNTAGMLQERTGHPTPRGSDVMRHVIGMHDWKTVLDPFCGSGTTLRAAKDLGRKAIGIEIEEKYCAIAAKRCEQEVLDFPPQKSYSNSEVTQTPLFEEEECHDGDQRKSDSAQK